MKFRKKPIVVEACEVKKLLYWAAFDWKSLPDWIIKAYDSGDLFFASRYIEILTIESKMEGAASDWIIRGVKGELYFCKPDVFEATYEKVDQ